MSSLNPIPRSTRRQDLVAFAGQTVFQPNNFRVYDTADLRVRKKVAGGTTFTTQTAGFTVALADEAPGFPVVTFAAGLAAGDTIRIEGSRVPSRTTDVTFGGSIRANPLEDELDKNVLTLQEVRRDYDDIANSLDTVDQAVLTVAGSASAAAGSASAAAGSATAAAGSATAAAGSATAAQTAANSVAPALAAKADMTYVDTQDSALASSIAGKADAAATTTALAGKADAAAMTTALAGKADTSAVAGKLDVHQNNAVKTMTTAGSRFQSIITTGVTGQRPSGAGPDGYSLIQVLGDSADLTTGGAGGTVQGALYVDYKYGGANAKGQRFTAILGATQDDNVNIGAYTATPQEIGCLYAATTVRDNFGVGGSAGNWKGAAFGGFFEVVMGVGALYYANASGLEVNTYLKAGAQVLYKAGIAVVTRDRARANQYDCALGISGFNESGVVGNKFGILFGPMNGAQPMATDGTGTLIRAVSGGAGSTTIQHVLDVVDYTITGEIIRSTGCSIAGSGFARFAGNVSIGPGVTPANNTALYLQGPAPGGATNLVYGVDVNGTPAIQILDSGNVLNRNNAYGSLSDERLKTDRRAALEVSGQLRRVAFEMFTKLYELGGTEGSEDQYGVIAQALREIFPDLVGEDAGGLLSVNYLGLALRFAKGWQESDARLSELEDRLASLEHQASAA